MTYLQNRLLRLICPNLITESPDQQMRGLSQTKTENNTPCRTHLEYKVDTVELRIEWCWLEAYIAKKVMGNLPITDI